MKKSYEMSYLNGLHMSSLGIRVTGTTNCRNVMCLLEIIKGKICSYKCLQLEKSVSHVTLHAEKLEEWRSTPPRFLICVHMSSGLRFVFFCLQLTKPVLEYVN